MHSVSHIHLLFVEESVHDQQNPGRLNLSAMKESKVAKTQGGILGDCPDEILSHILSFLPPTHAVRTSILSSRWKHLYKDVPNIESSIKKICLMGEILGLIAVNRVKMSELQVSIRVTQEEMKALAKSEITRGILETLDSLRIRITELQAEIRGMLEGMSAIVKLGKALSGSASVALIRI